MANGVVLSGAAIGLVVGAPLVHFLLNWYGLQGTFMILGGCALQCVQLGALIPPLHTDGEEQQLLQQTPPTIEDNKNENVTNTYRRLLTFVNGRLFHSFLAVDLLRRWKCSIVVVVSFLMDSTAMNTVYIYLPDMIIQAGYKKNFTWQPITILSVTNALARLTIGLKNKSPETTLIIYTAGTLVIGATTISFPLVHNYYWLICLLAGLFGLGKGIYMTLRGPVIAELVPEEDIDKAIGTASTFTGFSPILIYPVFGKMFDVAGTYILTFLISGINAIISSILLISVVCGVMKRK